MNGNNVIKWANEGGACVVPFPPVVCMGNHGSLSRSRGERIENCLHELFGVDGRCTYYGSYRCIKIVTMDWAELTSLGQEVSSHICYPLGLPLLTR